MNQKNAIKKSALSPTVLIVGGAGFVGSHLSEALLLNNARVIVLDNFSTGKDIYVNALLSNPKFALFNADINEGVPKEIESVDYIFHMAGLETYLFDKDDVNLESLLTNALGTKNALDFALKSQAKILLASTTDVYKGLISPLDLDQYFGQTQEEERIYSLAESKRYAEALVWEYFKKHNIDVRIARLPEIYGPRMNLESSGSLGSSLKTIMNNKDLVVYGDGVEKEYYLYIDDAVAGLIKSLFADNTKGKIYTFVPKEPHTVLETTYLVKSMANREARVVFKHKTKKSMTRDTKIPDVSNLRELSWDEKITFKNGIANTLKWFGYDVNEHSLKTNKLIDDKKEETKTSKHGIFSLRAKEKAETHIEKATKPVIEKGSSIIDKIFGGRLKFGSDQEDTPEIYRDLYKKKTPVGKLERILVVLKYLSLLVLVAIIFIGVPLLQTYIHAQKGVSNLKNSQENLFKLDIRMTQETSNEAFNEFYKAQRSLSRVEWLFSLLGKKEYFNDVQDLFGSVSLASKSAYHLAKGTGPFLVFWDAIKPNSETSFDREEFNSAKTSFVTARENLELAQAQLSQVDLNGFPSEVSEYSNKLRSSIEMVDVLTILTSTIPDLAGMDEKRSYLILFQNSNEIRPTGGFIGSYATIDLEEGKISSLVIDDIYNPDGQIDIREIQVDSPEPINEYLEEEFLHIRNANWFPEFPKSASQIEELFFKLDGRTYDGVLAVDLYFVENILEVVGPVYLTAYNEEITSENIYERAQFHSEFNYEEGSEQKRAFLTVLGGKILERFFSLEQKELLALGGGVQKSLNEKHLLVHIPNSAINAFFDEKGWNGKLVQTEGDYLYVVNSNLGGNKANYYVNNKMDYTIISATRDGLLRAELNLNYNHTGQDYSWPGGSLHKLR